MIRAIAVLSVSVGLTAWCAAAQPVTIDTTSLPSGTVGAPYSATVTASKGRTPYTWSVSAGALAAGLVLGPSSGLISGTPASAGTASFTVRVRDNANGTDTQALQILVTLALTITPASLPSGTVGATYSQTLSATGGTPPYHWTLASGALPSGISLNATTGALGGTPAAAGTFPFVAQVSDSASASVTQSFSITIAPPPLRITTTSLPDGTVGANYSQALAATGGTGAYTWSVSAGSLPQGLSLSTGGTISGIPASAGTATFTAQVTDGAAVKATQALVLVVAPAPITITTGSLPAATMGSAYSQTLAATGGTGGNSWSLSTGTLPQGLTLSAAGTISGTPTAIGSASFTVKVTDSSGTNATKPLSITVNPAPLSITTNSLPNGTAGVSYTQTLAAAGGAGGNTWSLASGTLPQGLALSGTGSISGTPTAPGTGSFTVKVTDSSGVNATKPLSITVNPAPLSITTSAVANGTVGIAYSQTLAASGGSGGNTWSLSSGSLPQGLTLSGAGTISGTPAASGAATFTVQVTDNSGTSATRLLSMIVVPPDLSITTTSLPNATVGTAYGQRLAASGGTGGYSWALASGSLPAGLTLDAGGNISGTPSAAGNVGFTVQVTDNSGTRTTAQLGITVSPAALSITTTSLPSGTVGAAYSQGLAASGGTGGYAWSLISGALPAGLTIDRSGTISGTPSASGNASFTVQVSDSSGTPATKQLSLAINAPALTITTASLPGGVTGAPYSQTLAASGGTGNYAWSVVSGNLPGGLALDTRGTLAGTPNASGSFAFTVQVADGSGTPVTHAFTIAIAQAFTISTVGVLANGAVGTPYTVSLASSGGTGAVTWALASGQLPPGLTLSPAGTISGVPTDSGTFGFTARATDTRSNTANSTFTITVIPALIITTQSTLSNGALGAPYSQALAASGGVPPYSWQIVAGSNLPPGLAMSSSGVISGTPTQGGTFRFTAQVNDASGGGARSDFTITIATGLTIATPPILPGATVGVAYTVKLQPAGGTAPFVWSVTAGSIPAGLNFGADGQIAGTPTATGSFRFTASVSDSSGGSATKDFTLASAPALTITTAPALPAGSTGTAYSLTLAAAGGTPAYLWSVTAGSLPPGITLDGKTGILSGTPSAAGDFTFTATVTDSVSATAQKQFTVSIGQGLAVTSAASLPKASAGVAYTFTLTAGGGASPYSWKIAGGSLPDGLSLNASSGVISGTPSLGGTFNFTVQVSDANGATGSRVDTIVVTLPSLPGLTLGGPADDVGPLQQPPLDIALNSAYPAALSGRVTLSFAPAGGMPDDPSVQFSAGGRSAAFTIPANGTHATFGNSPLALQTGSVAGVITVKVESLQSGDSVLPLPSGNARTIRVDPSPPVITGVTVIRTSGGFNVQLTAASNTRDLTQATVSFHPSANSNVATPQAAVPLKDVGQAWFQSAQSAGFGGQFTLTLPFTFQGGAVSLDSVSVKLTNSAGDSQDSSANY